MLIYVANHGGVYFGRDPDEVVLRMRLAEFRPEPRFTDAEYMQAVGARVAALGLGPIPTDSAEAFLAALLELGLLREPDRDLECPRADTICGDRRPECERQCWRKKPAR